MRTAKIWPVPEILEGGEVFKLKESNQHRGMICTDLVGKIMTVPTSEDAYGRMGRMHEMAHVAITPTEGMQTAAERGIGSDYVNVAEDMRVHQFLEDKRFNLEPSLPEDLFLHRVKGYQLENDFKGACLMAVACYRLPEYKLMLRNLSPLWKEKIEDIVRSCRYYLECERRFEQALEVARYLQDVLETETYITRALEPEYQERGTKWGEMTVMTPPLTMRLPQRKLNRRVRPNEFGGALMFPGRLDNDGKIFGNTRRIAKGTVLIDVSASMTLETSQIAEMVKAVPGVTVAVYSGDELEGHLTIIAKNGSMLKEDEMAGWPSGNVVDGPALKWLAKQSEPRVWVCDGSVTGIYDMDGPNLTQEALEIEEKNNILRTEYIGGAAALLKK